ncbi:MAG: hypothetical protein AB1646_09940 [Thermodesulfobacteriota bacterium]
MYFGAPRPEYYQEELGSHTKGTRITGSLVAEARTTTLLAEYRR